MMEPGPNVHEHDAPPDGPPRVPPYVALVRIGAVVAMSFATAFGIFLIIGGWWEMGLVLIALAVPFFFVMRVVEGAPEGADECAT